MSNVSSISPSVIDKIATMLTLCLVSSSFAYVSYKNAKLVQLGNPTRNVINSNNASLRHNVSSIT